MNHGPIRAVKRKRHWTAAEDALIRQWPALSAGEIAKRLPGRSRNAVIGRIWRLLKGYKRHGAPRAPRPPEGISTSGIAFVTRQSPGGPVSLARVDWRDA